MSDRSAVVVGVQGGAGDVLAATPMIRGMRKKYPKDELVVLSTHSYVLENNPNIDLLVPYQERGKTNEIYNKFIYGGQPLRFFKEHFPYNSFQDEIGKRSKCLPEFLCNIYGVNYDGKPLDYYITPYEEAAAKAFMRQFQKPVIMLHLTGVLPMKSFALDKIVPIIEKMNSDYDFVQVGAAGEPFISGIHNALGMPIRDTISIMPHMKLCILIESLFAHCSNALDLRSVVIFQSTSPEFFGYSNHFNVWDTGGCEHWPCNRPIGSLNKFLPAYRDLSTGNSLPWMCPEPLCSNMTSEDLEVTIWEAINYTPKSKSSDSPTAEPPKNTPLPNE